jgi:AmmeMemoRadiSam system protein B
MDHVGMDSIASQEPGAFAKYISLYKNTICGKHPIAVYLSALKENKESGVEQVQIHFVKYAQSSQVKYDHESSVSYASAVTRKV